MSQIAKISPRSVAAMKAGDVLWDADLSHFGARRRNAGIYYVLKVRINGRQRWLTIGRHGPLTPAEARAKARQLLAEVDCGRDPTRDRDVRRTMPTVTDLGDRWLREHVALKRKATTLAQYRHIVTAHINPSLGNTPVSQIDRADAMRLHAELAAHRYAANRTVAVLSAMMKYAEALGFRALGTNPCRGLERYGEAKRKRPLTRAELSHLWTHLADPDNGETIFAIAAIQLLLLTGMRKREVLSLLWSDVKLEHGRVDLRDSKTGPREVILSRLALELLAALPRREGNPFVICGDREGQHLVNLFKPWKRIRSHLGFPDVRVHDLRHTVGSILARSSPLVVVRDALGYHAIETTSGYSHAASDDVRRAVDDLAHQITGAQ